MIIAAYGQRLYKKDLPADHLAFMLKECNDAKIGMYSYIARGKISKDILNTTLLINKYGVNTYYANFIKLKIKESLSSNEELQKLYIEDYEQKILDYKEKINSKKEYLDKQKALKAKCIDFHKSKSFKKEFIKPYSFRLEDNQIIVISPNRKYTLQQFEYMIDKRMSKAKNTLYQMKNRLNRLNQQLSNIKKKPHITCFGTKHLFKLQHTTNLPHDEWKKKWQLKRHNNFVISGLGNREGGNMCVRYNFESETLEIMSHKQGILKEGKKLYKQKWFSIPYKFIYNKNFYEKAYKERKTIAYQIKDKGDYYIIIATFELDGYDKEKYIINDYLLDGAVGIDLNVDNFSLCNIDSKGNYLDSKVLHFDLDGKSSNQITKMLEELANEVFEYCREAKKPLIMEDIEKIKFKDTGSSETNKKLTQFAYDKMVNIITRKFEKEHYAIFKVNPSYTSQQGKIKYMKRFGLSIHQSAAFCIARRGLLTSNPKKPYYEDMGKYKRFGSIKYISKQLKKLRIKDFYELDNIPIDINKYKSLEKYVKDVKKFIEKRDKQILEDKLNKIDTTTTLEF